MKSKVWDVTIFFEDMSLEPRHYNKVADDIHEALGSDYLFGFDGDRQMYMVNVLTKDPYGHVVKDTERKLRRIGYCAKTVKLGYDS